MSETWWDTFVEQKLSGHNKCGTCGTVMMPDTVKLKLFFEWLQKKGCITPPEDREQHTKTIKALQDTQEELLKVKRERDELQKRMMENKNA